MSIYFAEKPEYYSFLSALEEETERYRKTRCERERILLNNSLDLVKTREKVFSSMHTQKRPHRYIQTHKSVPEKLRISYSHPKRYNSQATIIMPFAHQSKDLPVRKSSAKRIYEPAKLKGIEHNDKDAPLIIGQPIISLSPASSAGSDIFSEDL